MLKLSGLKCEQATQVLTISDDNYQRISDLIFDTDPFIYPALFGNEIIGKYNARLLLPAVFESNSDNMFSKSNLFIAYLNEVVVGIILWYNGNLNWSASTLLNCAKKADVQLVENNVATVQREYVESCYFRNGAIQDAPLSIINVCVAREHRGLGIARYMLNCFIGEHNNENMELAVLADNSAAITLYSYFGFEISKKTKGFSLSLDKPECLIMTRSKNIFNETININAGRCPNTP